MTYIFTFTILGRWTRLAMLKRWVELTHLDLEQIGGEGKELSTVNSSKPT